MKLHHHVQYLEQRMLENFCLQLALHLHHNGSTARPAIPMYAKPQYRPPTPQAFRRDDIISDHALSDKRNMSSSVADFSSLADSLDGADETDVAGIGGFGDPVARASGTILAPGTPMLLPPPMRAALEVPAMI